MRSPEEIRARRALNTMRNLLQEDEMEAEAGKIDAGTADAPPDEYAVVEIFGRRRHVGRILEVDRFGTKMLRVDVPKDGKFENGFVSHFYGGASIFGMTPCDLATVEHANAPSPWSSAGRLTYVHDEDEPVARERSDLLDEGEEPSYYSDEEMPVSAAEEASAEAADEEPQLPL